MFCALKGIFQYINIGSQKKGFFNTDCDGKTLVADKKKKLEEKNIRTNRTGFIHWQTGFIRRHTGFIRLADEASPPEDEASPVLFNAQKGTITPL